MKFKSPIISQASGSVAGATYSHNQGGLYIRARAIPTNPQTSFQQEVRAAFGNLATSWAALSEEQREGWRQYALNVPLVDRLGDARPTTGLAHYVRSNTPRIQAGLTVINDAPTTFNLGDTPVVTSAVIEETPAGLVAIAIKAGNTGIALNVLGYYSRPVSPTIVYFKGPFRYAGKLSVTDVASHDVVFNQAYNQGSLVVGQQVATQIRISLADGRLTQPAIVRTIVTPAV